MRKEDIDNIVPIGSLQLSYFEIEALLDLVISMFSISNSLRSDVPEELKAIRQKLSLLKEELKTEMNNRRSIVYKE